MHNWIIKCDLGLTDTRHRRAILAWDSIPKLFSLLSREEWRTNIGRGLNGENS